ncbi:Transcriptional regulatory protein EmbR [Streptomyces sp. YIM 121038]|nr:Transcriptional regulatory protein EmbR [Streptomyces sp. YIM 121038]
MQFLVLGPLQLMDEEKPIALGGDRRRATLGLLLLNANREVATSKLLDGLWGTDETPVTARKVLQNAVRGLRVTFAEHAHGDARPPALLTCAHGYRLDVDPEQVDMFRFHRLARVGRAELAAARPGAAAATLREALALWRGRALADLVESGHSWAELTALENARLDVMEDYYEAELAGGRHQAVLSDLEAMVEAEPLRERACHQLMLALYRGGRQADALAAYRRVRVRLAEQFGLEPGRELRLLQHAILVHDPAIAAPAVPARPVVLSGLGQETEPRERPVARPVQLVPAQRSVARSGVSTVLIRADYATGGRAGDVGRALERTARIVHEEVGRLGGVVAGSTGSVTLALFRAATPREEGAAQAAERAVRAAMALRQRICFDVPDGERPVLRVAVATGEMRARPGGSDREPLPVNGALLVDSESLLQAAEDTEIVVCGRTRRLTGAAIAYGREGGTRPRWAVKGRYRDSFARAEVFDREPELGVLNSLLERVRRRSRPHLVLVVGGPGIGKSPLLAAFERRVENAATVRLGPAGAGTPNVAKLAEHGPLVVFADDLHRADTAVLEFVEELLDAPQPLPVLVVAAARSELFRRRPGWGAGQRHASRMTLEPVAVEPRVEAPRAPRLVRLCHVAS